MSTVFEKIISGEWAGRFLWADDICVVISTIEPVGPGHALVIPRQPWAKWTDCPSDIAEHLMRVARIIALAQETTFEVDRCALIIAGFEVPHTHLHVIPARSEADCHLGNAQAASAQELDEAAKRLRKTLQTQGHGAYVPTRIDALL
ncbi:HIT family protein [Schaalia suimastitidis]|uniref:HIT family protein n=1 Tax=Schaalia suimastitidis TaxID=121163 RepID=UPI000412EE12|nr:HIT family protein [Schaalia suimastitidis]